MNPKDHWERVYSANPAEKLGWYEPHLRTSLAWIGELALPPDAPIIDVGGGASTLADDLLDAGHRAVTVLDVSAKALAVARARLGERAVMIEWRESDITSIELPERHFDLWHDRAVFHFLTAADEQRRYRDSLLRSLKPGGRLVIGVFAPEAPPRCSGLPVQRYSVDALREVLGAEFLPERERRELHLTPGGVEQMYLYCRFRRRK